MPVSASIPPFSGLSEDTRTEVWATMALRHTAGLGPRSITRLLRHFGSARSAYENTSAWSDAKVDKAKAAALRTDAWRTTAHEEWTLARRHNARILLWQSTAYPDRLRELPDAPALLYCQGDVSLLRGPALAVVGSRNCTAEGMRVVGDIVRVLSASGVTIVSGMAQGIDRTAHSLAMQGAGKSIGVLGTGLDIVYPPHNKDIFELLGTEGLLLTEFACGTPPLPGHFPVRNRIISGLSLGVLVVEATLRSGSLITARLAGEQNREVYAIPGPASVAASLGCQEMIRQGARPVFNADDILRDLAPQLSQFTMALCTLKEKNVVQCSPQKSKKPAKAKCAALKVPDAPPMLNMPAIAENSQAQRILEALHGHNDCPVDAVCVATGLSAASVIATLTELEVLAHVRRLPGGRYSLAKNAIGGLRH